MSSRRNSSNKNELSLKNDFESLNRVILTMTSLQVNLKKRLLQSQKQVENQMMKTIKMTQLRQQMSDFKNFFKCFSDECKNQWVSIYKELLTIINNIVEVYQIKIDKLENKIQEQKNEIDQLLRRSSCRLMHTQKLFSQDDCDFKPLTQYSEQSVQLSSSKKIKISDVIASYQSAIISSQVAQLRDIQNNQTNFNVDHNRSIFQKSFVKGGDSAIDFQGLSKFSKCKDNALVQVTFSNFLQKHPSKNEHKIHQISTDDKENFPSYTSSCRKMSEFYESRRESKSVRPKNRQNTEGSCVSKLSELRKYLYNKKRM